MESTVAYSGGGFSKELFATRDGAVFQADWLTKLALQGQIFMAGDADANDRVTGQTSFADTTPTFLIDVPTGTICMPLSVYLNQAGSVAGAAISVHMAISSAARAYASGGTAETIFGARTDRPVSPNCLFYSGATATTALLTKQVRSWELGQDVAPAEGAVPEVIWTPEKQGHPLLIVGPASLAVFTWAGTTGPTWNWSFSWAELDDAAI
jgi:hypothetical protein